MDQATVQFSALLDLLVQKVERVRAAAGHSEGWIVEAAERTVHNVSVLKQTAESGRLPRPSRGQVSPRAGLGLSRGISDWTQDPDLLDTAYRVEDFYRTHM